MTAWYVLPSPIDLRQAEAIADSSFDIENVMLFLTRTASRLACNWQQGRPSTAAIVRECSLARLGSMGSVALHDIVSNPTVMGRASSAIVIRLHWSLRHHQRGKCSRYAKL